MQTRGGPKAYPKKEMVYLGVWTPPRMPVANEGLVRNPYQTCNVILVVTGILGGAHTQGLSL